MLCLLPRYLLFRFNLAASSARIPRIFNYKSYLMVVSSNLIKKSFIQYIVWTYIVIPSRLIVEENVVLIYMTPGKWIDDGGQVIISTPVVQSPNSSMRKAQYAGNTICRHQTVQPVGFYGHIPTGL